MSDHGMWGFENISMDSGSLFDSLSELPFHSELCDLPSHRTHSVVAFLILNLSSP